MPRSCDVSLRCVLLPPTYGLEYTSTINQSPVSSLHVQGCPGLRCNDLTFSIVWFVWYRRVKRASITAGLGICGSRALIQGRLECHSGRRRVPAELCAEIEQAPRRGPRGSAFYNLPCHSQAQEKLSFRVWPRFSCLRSYQRLITISQEEATLH